MGLFDDLFGTSTPPSSGGLFDSFFGGSGSFEQQSSPSLFGGYGEPTRTAGGLFSGYGDQPFEQHSDAEKSGLIRGIVKDPDTGYVGTPAEIYDKYLAEGRNPARLVKRFHK